MPRQITVNREQGLYVIPSGGGYSCLGFNVLESRAKGLIDELSPGIIWTHRKGSMAAYSAYQKLIKAAKEKNRLTGWRSKSELTPQLIGLEGCRVEVVDCYGEKRRFNVGKSTGFIPCHLEIYNRVSSAGPSVTGTPFKSVKVVTYA